MPGFRIVKNNDFSDLESLPADTGGKHLSYRLGETDAPYGFFIYIPAGYEQTSATYPLLVFLHGDGEQGNSSDDAGVIDLVLVHGPPYLINEGRWNPTYPMLVVSPQCHDEFWQAQKVDDFIRYIVKNYRVSKSRIYMTGLSGGGDGIYRYLAKTGNRSLVAAAVIICGEGTVAQARKARVPVWIFHGAFDDIVPVQTAIEMKQSFTNVPEAKLTIYPDVDHGGWHSTYDLTGMGTASKEYDPFDISIYDWLFTYSLSEE